MPFVPDKVQPTGVAPGKPTPGFVPDSAKPTPGFVPDKVQSTAQPPKKEGIISRMGNVIKEEYKRMEDKAFNAVDASALGEQTWGEAVWQTGAAATGSGARILSRGAVGMIKAITPDFIEEAVKESFVASPAGQALGIVVPHIQKAWDDFKTEHPRWGRNLTAVGDVVEAYGTIKLGNKVEGWLREKVPQAAANIKLAAEARKARGISLQEGNAYNKLMDPNTPQNLLQSGAADSRVAGQILDDTGAIVSDPKAKYAISQGVDPGDVSYIKNSSRGTKDVMEKMVDTRVAQTTNKSIQGRASDEVGRVFADEHVRPLQKLNTEAASMLDDVADDLIGQPIIVDDAYNSFVDDLARHRVGIGTNGKLIFDGSDFHNLTGPQKALNDVWEMLNSVDDARDAHGLKRYIDSTVVYGGDGGAALKGEAKNIIKSLRHNIDLSLDTTYSDYNAVNSVYSDTRYGLDALRDAAGPGMDLSDDFAAQAAGTKFRGLWANTQFRDNMGQALQETTGILSNYGITPQTDIYALSRFATVLDARLGAEAVTSAQGILETAGDMTRLGQSFASGNPVGIARGLAAVGGDVAKLIAGSGNKGFFKAIYGLLSETY